MKARIRKTRLLAFLDAVTALTDEGALTFGKEGVSVVAVDPARVALVDARLPTTAFEELDGAASMPIDLKRLQASVALIDAAEVKLSSVENRAVVEGGDMRFKISLIDPIGFRKPPQIPTPGQTTIRISGAELSRSCAAAQLADTDQVLIAVKDGSLTLGADGDTSQMTLTHEACAEGPDAQSGFNLDYLKDISQMAKTAESLVLNIGTDYPLRLRMPLDGDGSAVFVLAPRVEK